MSRSSLWSAVVFIALLAPPARAGAWSLGTHLGASAIDSGESKGSTGVWALPSTVLVYQPGLRLAYGDTRRVHELQADAGVLVLDQAGSTLGLVAGSLSYQHAFLGDRRVGPLVNVAMGFLRESSVFRTTVAPLFGFGAGVRRVVGNEHGSIRAEVRWDQVGREDRIGRPTLNVIGLRLGFDLWL